MKHRERNTTKLILKTYWLAAWRYPRYVIALLVLTPLATIFLRLLPPLVLAKIFNALSERQYTADQPWESFGPEILLYAVILFLGGVLGWRLVLYFIWKLETSVQRDLYRQMFDKYMNLDANFHANSFGGSLVSRTNKYVGAYIRLQDTFVFQVYTLFWSFLFISVVLYGPAPLFVWGFWAFSVVFTILAVIFSRPVRELTTIEADAQNKTTGYLADSITNVFAIKSFAGGKSERSRFAAVTENMKQKGLDVMRATTKRDTASSMITTTIGIAAVVAAVIAVVNHNADIGLVFLLIAYTGDISERLWELSSTTLRQYNRAIGDAQEAVNTLNTEEMIKDPVSPKLFKKVRGDVTFENMKFTHVESADDSLFTDFNLTIPAGTKVGLVGHSGSGKTTLTKLLLRFMDVDDGSINIDGRDIRSTTQDDLRRHIAYVPQEPLLFHRSLSENIGYGRPDASQKEIEKVAKLAHAHEFIKDLPKTYDTLVGERGVKLSGGQRQRVAIARAMIKDAPILVLDEATSALDSEGEVLIQDALWKLMEGRTALVIAHRLSTVQKMDHIVVMEEGKIVEQATHKELIAKKGTYADLWNHQTGGFLED